MMGRGAPPPLTPPLLLSSCVVWPPATLSLNTNCKWLNLDQYTNHISCSYLIVIICLRTNPDKKLSCLDIRVEKLGFVEQNIFSSWIILFECLSWCVSGLDSNQPAVIACWGREGRGEGRCMYSDLSDCCCPPAATLLTALIILHSRNILNQHSGNIRQKLLRSKLWLPQHPMSILRMRLTKNVPFRNVF